MYPGSGFLGVGREGQSSAHLKRSFQNCICFCLLGLLLAGQKQDPLLEHTHIDT